MKIHCKFEKVMNEILMGIFFEAIELISNNK